MPPRRKNKKKAPVNAMNDESSDEEFHPDSEDSETVESVYRTDVTTLKPGDHLSRHQYYKVVSVDDEDVTVCNDENYQFDISRDIVAREMYSCHYKEEKKVSRTEIIRILQNAKDCIFEVNFNKKPNFKTISDAIANAASTADTSTFSTKAKREKYAKSLLLGEERTLVGHLVKVNDEFGRTHAIDLNINAPKSTDSRDPRERQIDHRTINYLIIQNVKYICK